MASRRSLPEVDLSCPICCEIFKDPVVLKCSHSFCAPCLQQYWSQRVRSRDCPLCRSQALDDPVPSLTLKNLCESYITQDSVGSEEKVEELYCDPGEMCPVHGERLKLFCLQDKKPICVVCHTSKKHKQHDCCPVSEAAADVKEKMKSALSSLQEKRDAFNKMKKNYEDTVAYIQKCESTLASVNCPVEDPVMAPGALIDVAKYVGSLAFHVWEKMHKVVKYTPVTLDPNTAAPWLVLSDDLASVCDSDEKQKLPDNPERFDPDTGVLGNEGFTSGKHAWDVSVGDNTAWVVGVAKESVQRKEKVSSVLVNGYLCVYFYHKMYFAGTSPLTRLNLKKNPQRIRVMLDCDKGKVSFYSPHDNTHIYTFKHTITEKVFPYFWVGCQQCPLTVEPQEVSVRAVEYC
ncbi:nuclear factor 7, brain-like isoform X2 [Toxotes jaculatrix]|uniref:nuclear factor 7, brain-like isoform X2 n=1 Tax=Toxotes jaculatrix TaxID=941984 RepID=UPI001B3B086D|nr:nuclear factor 7, brain-like isoform X2 [Toxotes jaculatrix]